MGKFEIKQMIKAAKVPVIIGSCVFLVGAILLIIGCVASVGGGLLYAGLIVAVIGGIIVAVGIGMAKDTMHAICSECHKFMGDSDEPASYEFAMTDYKEVRDSTGKFNGYDFTYTCSITCPHCGATNMFTTKRRDQTQAKANASVNNEIKAILKRKKKN